MTNQRDENRYCFSERVPDPMKIKDKYKWVDFNIFAGKTQLVQHKNYKYFEMERDNPMLFDISKDPFEKQNLIDDEPEIASRMKKELHDYMGSFEQHTQSYESIVKMINKEACYKENFNELQEKSLRGLGYAD